MGKRGPKPKPTAMRIFEGNPSRRPLNKCEPIGPDADLSCPDWLSEIGAAKWEEVAPMLSGMRVLTQADRDVLSCYCEAWAEFHESREIIEKNGITAVGEKGGEYIHPAVNIKNSALKRIKEFGALLGLNPVARMGLKTDGKETASDFDADMAKHA